jgi:formylglycine-generating enzyme required for sulfatase activity
VIDMTIRAGLIVAFVAGCASTSVAQDLIRVPGGTHEVTDQITTLKVSLSVSEFLLGAAEVTQKEYEAITSSNPSVYKGADRPVENVSWWEAIRYCNLRSARESLTPCYDLATGERDRSCTGYRLPTETEWIVAAGALPREPQLREVANLGVPSTKSLDVFGPILERGTAPVRSRKPGASGLFDLRGNVWEWTGDYFDPIASPDAVRDPSGPPSGLARVIRGGSFASSTSSWSREFRSSMNPGWRSRFTGFRVARSSQGEKPAQKAATEVFFRRYNAPPPGFESSIGSLTALAPAWKQNAAAIRAKWDGLLKVPTLPGGTPAARVVREIAQRNFAGQLIELELEAGVWEKVYVLRPPNVARRPLPVVIVPFYDVDTPAAADLGGRSYAPDRGVNAYAYTAAQHGYLAVAVRWFGESYGESYSEAVANLAMRHPGSTGLGKWIADARRVVDFIETLPDADAGRIGIFGHSLGGKMALYATAFEPRIRAAVSSELGVGFTMSNYDDYWYLGDRLASAPAGTDQHELIALIAPRPFLLIGGDEYDKQESWHYINAARAVYELSGSGTHVGYFNHHKGHTPTPEAVSVGFDWLDYFLKP